MASININTVGGLGVEGVFQQEENIEGDQFSGYTYTTTYTGNEAQIRQLAVQFGNEGWKIKLTVRNNGQTSNYASLDVSKPDDTILPPTTWQVKSQTIEQNVIEASSIPMVSGLTANDKLAIEKSARTSGAAGVSHLTIPTTKTVPTADYVEKTNALYQCLMADASKIARPVKVFKKIQVLPYSRTPSWTKQYEGKVVSKNTLISLYEVPSWLIPELPDDPVSGIQIDPVTKLNLMYGYFVGGIDGQSNARQRMQWEQDFTYDRWLVYSGDRDWYGLYQAIP